MNRKNNIIVNNRMILNINQYKMFINTHDDGGDDGDESGAFCHQ